MIRPEPHSSGTSDNIRRPHLERLAVVYVHQSIQRQVLENRESTELQYKLTRRAEQPVHAEPRTDAEGRDRPAERAKQEIEYGRRGKGYIFGAFRPATGEALTHPYPSRSAANWADFLGRVEAWIPAEVERIYAIVDNLNAHRAMDILLFALAFARWEFVFQPKYAAYLNLIEPWWKVLRSLALRGRRFETWEEVCGAVDEATAYWRNKHRHPFVWGRRRRHRPRRRPGIASVPGVRGLTG